MASALTITSTIKLNSGHSIPALGLGFALSQTAIQAALYSFKIGYRHIDSARHYKNEAELGKAANESGLKRDELFLTTKIMSSDYSKGTAHTLKCVNDSLSEGRISYFDLYLLHDPTAGKKARLEGWKGLELAVTEGKVKSIGVSNFGVKHLEEIKEAGVKIWPPAVNQIELHPWCQQKEIVEYCKKEGIVVEAYCPLVRGKHMDHPTLVKVAESYKKTPAQVLVRWSVQSGFVSIPKSDKEHRIEENADIYDFELSEESMNELNALDQGDAGSISWNPTHVP